MQQNKQKNDITHVLKLALKERNNPKDLKAMHIGKVVNLSPLTATIAEGKISLSEGDELFISEWFRFRCNINKTSEITTAFNADLATATGVTEIHSNGGASCNMPTAIAALASAITRTNNELLALKCDLKVNDLVLIGSLEQTDRYILIDKVLDDNYKFYGDD